MRPGNHASLKGNRRVVDGVTMGIGDMKLGAAKHANQLAWFYQEAGLFPALTNGGVSGNLVGVNRTSWKHPKSVIGVFGQQQPSFFIENRNRRCRKGEKVMTDLGAKGG